MMAEQLESPLGRAECILVRAAQRESTDRSQEHTARLIAENDRKLRAMLMGLDPEPE